MDLDPRDHPSSRLIVDRREQRSIDRKHCLLRRANNDMISSIVPKRTKPLDKIFLRGLQFFGRHGVLQAEAELGQPFVVDVELRTCLRKAGISDDVRHTVDYSHVFTIAKDVIEGGGTGSGSGSDDDVNKWPRCNLVETLATRIATDILNDCHTVAEVTVSVSKPHVAFAATLQDVGVQIVRSRDDLPDHTSSI